MKVMIITGSRADWSGLAEVAGALVADNQNVRLCIGGNWMEQDARVAVEAAGLEFRGAYLLPCPPPRIAWRSAAVAGFAVAATAGACRLMDTGLAVVCGDRSEVLASALGCHLQGVPIAHIAGGDVTQGSADDRMRNAISMMASLHFPTHDKAAIRLVTELGIDPARVHLYGSPAVDRLLRLRGSVSRETSLATLGFDPARPTLMVSVHPATVPGAPDECGEILHALVDLEQRLNGTLQIVIMEPNTDEGSDTIRKRLLMFCEQPPGRPCKFVRNVPPDDYARLLASCDAMLGNSSAGVYEAPVLGVPSVVVGDRQLGRPRTAWGYVAAERLPIAAVAYNALVAGRAGRVKPTTVFGDGTAASKIATIIGAWRVR